ncbi:MAG: molybdopterin-dependent oxidoreductase [Magnetococcales bacterium]|nr:molybdopterin-dependent oxidoreductase [Magnetococcales bacterium]
MPETHAFSTCALDCPGACALHVTTEEQRLQSIKGDPNHPFTQGIICGKVARYEDIQQGNRITQPLQRIGAKGEGLFREISWDEAMEQAVNKIQTARSQWGAESIYPYYSGGTMGVVQKQAIERLSNRAGFSRMEETICYSIGFSGWQAGVGLAIGPNPTEIAESDLVVLWGINAVVTHITLMHHVKKARKKGAKLIVVDPYRNQTAKLADYHIAPLPGSDGALACAMMHILLKENLADWDYLAEMTDFDGDLLATLEEKTPEWAAPLTGLSVEEIIHFARLYGQASAPFIRVGIGMSRQNNGAVNIHAVSCLPALTGAWKKRGGGALFATGDCFHINKEPILQKKWLTTPTRRLDSSRLGYYLTATNLSPPLAVLMVFNANPAGSCPNLDIVHQGLAREDLFTIVHEQVMTDTARFADLIFPATTFLEHEDIYRSYGQTTLQHAKPLLPPPGEACCNHDLVNDLAQRLGYDEAPFRWDVSEMVNRVVEASDYPPICQWQGQRWLECSPSWEESHFLKGFPQKDGRFHFYPRWPDPDMPPVPDHWAVNRRDGLLDKNRYPLDLMLPPANAVLNTTFSHSDRIKKDRGPPQLMINPLDAQRRHIQQGDTIQVFNDLARLTLTANITQAVRPGLCVGETNHAGEAFPEGIAWNALAHDTRVAPKGGPAFHDNRVDVALLSHPNEKSCEST